MADPAIPVREGVPSKWVELSPGALVRRMVEGNGASLALYRLAPGTKFDLHEHPFSELGVVLAGSGTFLIEGERRPCREGDSFFFPPGSRHGFEVSPNQPAVLLNVTVSVPEEVVGPGASSVVRGDRLDSSIGGRPARTRE